jgi:hypothetical protein
MNAKKAVELGFADEVLYEDKGKPETEEEAKTEEGAGGPVLEALMYQGRVTDLAVLNSIGDRKKIRSIVLWL